jgi:hypothetical protein
MDCSEPAELCALLRVLNQLLDHISGFPCFDLPFESARFEFIRELFCKDHHPVFSFSSKTFVIGEMPSQAFFDVHFGVTDVVFV